MIVDHNLVIKVVWYLSDNSCGHCGRSSPPCWEPSGLRLPPPHGRRTRRVPTGGGGLREAEAELREVGERSGGGDRDHHGGAHGSGLHTGNQQVPAQLGEAPQASQQDDRLQCLLVFPPPLARRLRLARCPWHLPLPCS